MVIENVAVHQTTSQKAKRPRNPPMEGNMETINGQNTIRPQRGWLSSGSSTGNYVYDKIGGAGSFLYVIGRGFLEDKTVGTLFWPYIYLSIHFTNHFNRLRLLVDYT
jgi:hypothetical protein